MFRCLLFLLAILWASACDGHDIEAVLQTGHARFVAAVSFSSDDRLLASGDDGSLIFWDPRTGNALRSIKIGYMPRVMSFYKDNSKFVTAGIESRSLLTDSTPLSITVWDINTGASISRFEVPNAGVRAVKLSKNGELIALSDLTGEIKVWDVLKGTQRTSVKVSDSEVSSLEFSNDGRNLSVGCSDGAVAIWDLHSGKQRKFQSAFKAITSLALSPNGEWIAYAGPTSDEQMSAVIANLDTNEALYRLPTEKREISSLVFTRRNELITMYESGPELWAPTEGRKIRKISWNPVQDMPIGASSMDLSSDEKDIAIGTITGFVVISSMVNGEPRLFLPRLTHRTGSMFGSAVLSLGLGVKFSLNGNCLASASLSGVSIWDLKSGAKLRTFGTGSTVAFAFDDACQTVLIGTNEGQIHLWDVSTGSIIRSSKIGNDKISSLALDKNAMLVASISESGDVTLWRPGDGASVRHWSTPISGRSSLVFSPDDQFLAVEDEKGNLFVFSVPEGTLINSLSGSECGRTSPTVVYSPNGKDIASACADILRLSDALGHTVMTMRHHEDQITAIAFNTKGDKIVTASLDRTLELWDALNKRPVATFMGSGDFINGASFSPDGKWLASLEWNGIVTVWSTVSAAPFCTLVTTSYSDDWLVTDRHGHFDGSESAWPLAMLRAQRGLDVFPLEAFFKDGFRPGLLTRILDGESLQDLPQSLTDTAAPKAKLSLLVLPENVSSELPDNVERTLRNVQDNGGASLSGRTFNVRVKITSTQVGIQSVNGVRLFRNGSLVKVWRHEIPLGPTGEAILSASIMLPAGNNKLAAYAFGPSGIKTADANVDVNITGQHQKGTLYVLVIGIDQYSDPKLKLRYAVADAKGFADQLETLQSGSEHFSRTIVARILNENATKIQILATLKQLSDQNDKNVDSKGHPEAIETFTTAQPEDALIIYFAGHGMADGGRFFLVPHDVGEWSSATPIKSRVKQIESNSISDLELESALENIDAGQFALIVDACNSGQILKLDRPGPLDSDGLAQLAYEKGMYVLAASESYELAQEVNRFGHGLLTYALVQEGLKEKRATESDGRVVLRNWLEYPVKEVPRLQAELQQKSDPSRGFKGRENSSSGIAQHPRVFHRREEDEVPLILGRVSTNN